VPEQLAVPPRRALRVLLLVVLLAEAALAVLALVLFRAGRSPPLDEELQHSVAYGWVLVTMVAALTAYVLAGGARDRPRAGIGRALAVAALTDGAALAGIVAFFLVPVWPILAIAGLTALLGLVLAWPRDGAVAEPVAAPGPSAPPAAEGPGAPPEAPVEPPTEPADSAPVAD